MAATNASVEAEAEARSILERAAESSFPPLHAVHHLLSVGVRLLLPAHVLAALFGVRCLISHDSVSPPREPVRFAERFLCLILHCCEHCYSLQKHFSTIYRGSIIWASLKERLCSVVWTLLISNSDCCLFMVTDALFPVPPVYACLGGLLNF